MVDTLRDQDLPADSTRGGGLLALVASGRRHPLRVFASALAVAAVFMWGIGEASDTQRIIGLPGSVAALLAVLSGALAGPFAGAAVALAGGGLFYIFVADLGGDAGPLVTALSTALWVAAGVVSGLLAESLREREARRLETALSLAQTRAAHAAQEEVAELHGALERSLLPSESPRHPELRIVTAYRPGEKRLQLGGDFFDVLSLPDGDLALIIGDVVGHGPEAAALGARLRAAWQGLTLSDADMATIATSLNEMVGLSGAEELVTACLARLRTNEQQGRFLSAGHPPPLLLTDGVATVEVMPCLPFGISRQAGYEPLDLALPEDWALFFYTDGLIEGRAAPSTSERYGEARLMARLGTLRAIDEPGVDRLIADVERAHGGGLDDDVAIIVVSQRP